MSSPFAYSAIKQGAKEPVEQIAVLILASPILFAAWLFLTEIVADGLFYLLYNGIV